MAELLTTGFGTPAKLLPLALFMFGASGVAGNAVAGIAGDRLGHEKVIWLSLAILGVMLSALTFVSGPVAGMLLLAGCAFAGTLFTAPQQVKLTARVDPLGHAFAFALNSSASYLGITVGSGMASVVYSDYGLEALPLASAGLLIVSAILNKVSASTWQ